MTSQERGGIVGTYSSGVKMTLKVRIAPMETNLKHFAHPFILNFTYNFSYTFAAFFTLTYRGPYRGLKLVLTYLVPAKFLSRRVALNFFVEML